MVTALILILFTTLSVVVFMKQAQFGKAPKGERLERIKVSVNYSNGAFQNLSPTPDLTEGANFYSVAKEFLFTKKERNKPTEAIISLKTDLLNLSPEKDVMVWFGHSSYLCRLTERKL